MKPRSAGHLHVRLQMTNRSEFYIYLVGVCIFGLLYETIKQALSPAIFFGVAIAYIILIRIVGRYIATRITHRVASKGSDDA